MKISAQNCTTQGVMIHISCFSNLTPLYKVSVLYFLWRHYLLRILSRLRGHACQEKQKEAQSRSFNFTFHYIDDIHRHMGPGFFFFFFFSILSIKCASTTYMNPFDMLRCEINAFMNYVPFS